MHFLYTLTCFLIYCSNYLSNAYTEECAFDDTFSISNFADINSYIDVELRNKILNQTEELLVPLTYNDHGTLQSYNYSNNEFFTGLVTEENEIVSGVVRFQQVGDIFITNLKVTNRKPVRVMMQHVHNDMFFDGIVNNGRPWSGFGSFLSQRCNYKGNILNGKKQGPGTLQLSVLQKEVVWEGYFKNDSLKDGMKLFLRHPGHNYTENCYYAEKYRDGQIIAKGEYEKFNDELRLKKGEVYLCDDLMDDDLCYVGTISNFKASEYGVWTSSERGTTMHVYTENTKLFVLKNITRDEISYYPWKDSRRKLVLKTSNHQSTLGNLDNLIPEVRENLLRSLVSDQSSRLALLQLNQKFHVETKVAYYLQICGAQHALTCYMLDNDKLALPVIERLAKRFNFLTCSPSILFPAIVKDQVEVFQYLYEKLPAFSVDNSTFIQLSVKVDTQYINKTLTFVTPGERTVLDMVLYYSRTSILDFLLQENPDVKQMTILHAALRYDDSTLFNKIVSSKSTTVRIEILKAALTYESIISMQPLYENVRSHLSPEDTLQLKQLASKSFTHWNLFRHIDTYSRVDGPHATEAYLMNFFEFASDEKVEPSRSRLIYLISRYPALTHDFWVWQRWLTRAYELKRTSLYTTLIDIFSEPYFKRGLPTNNPEISANDLIENSNWYELHQYKDLKRSIHPLVDIMSKSNWMHYRSLSQQSHDTAYVKQAQASFMLKLCNNDALQCYLLQATKDRTQVNLGIVKIIVAKLSFTINNVNLVLAIFMGDLSLVKYLIRMGCNVRSQVTSFDLELHSYPSTLRLHFRDMHNRLPLVELAKRLGNVNVHMFLKQHLEVTKLYATSECSNFRSRLGGSIMASKSNQLIEELVRHRCLNLVHSIITLFPTLTNLARKMGIKYGVLTAVRQLNEQDLPQVVEAGHAKLLQVFSNKFPKYIHDFKSRLQLAKLVHEHGTIEMFRILLNYF